MVEELIRGFLLILAAEMGDKTQIIAMTFATQYLVREVLIGVALGVFFNHGIAILLGSFISKVVPMNMIQIIAGFLFILFGLNALKIDEDEKLENKKEISPIITVALAFFIGELGDKTQLTAMTLSAEANYPFFVLIGTTLGMITTSSLGIFVGSKIGDKIPELSIKIVSSLVFISFGTIKLYNTLPEKNLTYLNIIVFFITLCSIELMLIRKLLKQNRSFTKSTPLKEIAERLYKQTQTLRDTLDSICLGEGSCGKCTGVECLLGYTRYILSEARNKGEYYSSLVVNTNKLKVKDYDANTVIKALAIIIKDFQIYGWKLDDDFVVVKIKDALEVFLFGVSIKNVNTIEEYITATIAKNADIGLKIKELVL